MYLLVYRAFQYTVHHGQGQGEAEKNTKTTTCQELNGGSQNNENMDAQWSQLLFSDALMRTKPYTILDIYIVF